MPPTHTNSEDRTTSLFRMHGTQELKEVLLLSPLSDLFIFGQASSQLSLPLKHTIVWRNLYDFVLWEDDYTF